MIKEILLASGTRYTVGKILHDGRQIGEIKDISAEYPDHIYWIYEVFDTGSKPIAAIRDIGAEITYAK